MTSPLEQSELTAISDTDKIAVNCSNPARQQRQRDYIGCISPKTIKGITYQYWVWREKGKRHYRCMGTDRSSAIAKAKATYDPRFNPVAHPKSQLQANDTLDRTVSV